MAKPFRRPARLLNNRLRIPNMNPLFLAKIKKIIATLVNNPTFLGIIARKPDVWVVILNLFTTVKETLPVAKSSAKNTKAPTKPATKSEVLTTISDQTDLTKKDVSSVLDALSDVIKKQLGRRGPGVLAVPGLMKLSVQRKPATKARKGINPFTKEEIMINAKPARNVVKIRPLKNLKEMVK